MLPLSQLQEDTHPDLHAIAAHIPTWSKAQDKHIEPLPAELGGLTNTNYRVLVDNETYVMRVSGKNTSHLGIDRKIEREIAVTASEAGIGIEVVAYVEPAGHLITRFLNGKCWTSEEAREPENIRRLADALRQLHALEVPGASQENALALSCEQMAKNAKQLGLELPANIDRFRERMWAMDAEWRQDSQIVFGLCHNDLCTHNMLDNGSIHFLDWEFAGYGNVCADLIMPIALCGFSPEQRDYLLQCYFDKNWEYQREVLGQVRFLLHFRDGIWALVQHGLNEGKATHDYLGESQCHFHLMENWL